jgi:hypothetical protein
MGWLLMIKLAADRLSFVACLEFDKVSRYSLGRFLQNQILFES